MATDIEGHNIQEFSTNLEDDKQLLRQLNRRTYTQQAVCFLNAFWKDIFENNRAEAEAVWFACACCVELDQRKEDGNELDQFTSHRLLAKVDRALTAIELRDTLASIDLDNNKSMSLVEFLIFKFKVDWRKLVHAPQGIVDEAKLRLAEEKVAAAQQAIVICEDITHAAFSALRNCTTAEKLAKENSEEARKRQHDAAAAAKVAVETEEGAKRSEENAVRREEDAIFSESRAKTAEEKTSDTVQEQKAIQHQVEEALAAVNRERDSFKEKCDSLEKIANDCSNGIVKRNSAKAELAQLQCTDPMPLQRAIISHNAIVRRQERMTKTAAAAEIAAIQARAQAEESRQQATRSRKSASEERKSASLARKEAEEMKCFADIAHEQAKSSHCASELAREKSEMAKNDAEKALQQSALSFQEASRFLEETKRECKGAGKGKLWWMSRELEESKKYMSRAQLARLESAKPLDEDIPASCA